LWSKLLAPGLECLAEKCGFFPLYILIRLKDHEEIYEHQTMLLWSIYSFETRESFKLMNIVIFALSAANSSC
jgi:hypothetical protein